MFFFYLAWGHPCLLRTVHRIQVCELWLFQADFMTENTSVPYHLRETKMKLGKIDQYTFTSGPLFSSNNIIYFTSQSNNKSGCIPYTGSWTIITICSSWVRFSDGKVPGNILWNFPERETLTLYGFFYFKLIAKNLIN